MTAMELAKQRSVQLLNAEIMLLMQSEGQGTVSFNLSARDALIDLIKFFGPEETQKCIEIANLKKFGE